MSVAACGLYFDFRLLPLPYFFLFYSLSSVARIVAARWEGGNKGRGGGLSERRLLNCGHSGMTLLGSAQHQTPYKQRQYSIKSLALVLTH